MKLIFSLSLFLFSVTTLLAQTLYTRNDSIPITQDSVTIKAGPFRGNIQWQKSLDKKNWINLAGKTSDSLKVETSIEAMYRAVISEGTCLPVYSDTANLAFTVPKVLTSIAAEIADNSALIGGNVISNGGDLLCERGVCYSISQNPTIANTKVIMGKGTGSFTNTVSGLFPNTTYYVRAYSTNSAGTGYGNEVTFKTTRDAYICGTDTVVLRVENYYNGVIEWQESLDTVNWVTIPEASGTTYKFLPTQTKYYRSLVKTSTSEPLPSSITLVQLPPLANAGSDRIIGGTKMTLLGNQVIGAQGEWKIISGEGGEILDPTNQSSEFTGIYNQNYQLVWSLQNLCGQSSDTVVIKFEEIASKNNFIVVDNTDHILSDSTEMATGTYKIKFSDTNIAPFDSVMLIAMREDISFLRKVNAFTFQDSIYTFNTTQGTFQDLFKSGVLNMGDAVNQGMIQDTAQLKSANVFPTRKTLKNNSNNTGIKLLYVGTIAGEGNPGLKSATSDANQEVFTLPLPSVKIFATEDESVTFSIKDAYIEIAPKFVLDYNYSFPATLTKLRIGVDNGEFEYNFKTELVATSARTLAKETTLLEVDKHIFFMAGVIPVDVVAKFAVKASCNMNISASMKLEETKNYKVNLTALVEGDNVNNLRLNYNPSVTSTHEENFVSQGELSSEFKIGPEISFVAYGIVGPYLTLPAKLDMAICANTDKNWEANASIGFEGYLGARADIVVEKFLFPKIEINLFDFKYALFNNAFTKSIKMPYQLELLSGNFQSGVAGQTLSRPISLRTLSSTGFGVPLVPVRFELGNGDGTVSQKVLYSDATGRVSVDWTLGVNPKNTLKISVLDCDNNDIENSPMYLYANSTTATSDCTNSNLTISLKTTQGNMYPSVSGGTSPYTYSKNGIDYSSNVPLFNVSVPGHNTVYVKDKNQCIKTRAFEIEPIVACAASNLSLDVLVQPNILTITGKNGMPPYTFAVDNTSNFTTTNIYNKLTAGTHAVYVKDGNGCVASKDVIIESQTIAAIKASYPMQGATSVPVSGVTFQWVAANYTTNQLYDLSLKKGSEAYSLIASNLSATSYTYNTALANSSNYTWKLAVKGSNGVVIDYSEFTFSTASGNSTIPIVPTLLQPANGSNNPGLPITLSWNLQAGDFNYDLYLDETNANKLIVNNLNYNEFAVNNLTFGKKYYWKVRIKNRSTGEYKESAVWNFTPQQSTTGTVTTNSITAITQTTAISGGNVTSDGGATVTARGVCWSTSQNPTTANSKTTYGSGTGIFTSDLTGLTANTLYYVRAYAINSVGTAYGDQVTFTTGQAITQPAVTTNAITDITQTTATCGGNVTSDGGATITSRGVCWSTSQNPTTANTKTTNGSGTGNFTSNITGLNANTLYYVRAYAINSAGTAYGDQVTFTTTSGGVTGTVTDIDGNVYKTIQIGTHTWMAENLKTTKFKDGSAITSVTDAGPWINLSTPAYCWYNNDAATNKASYGALYNWYAINTGNLCLTGWHVPTDAEWTRLTTYMGGETVAGGKLKETGTGHWFNPNTGATNETGFTALPGGYRDGYNGIFEAIEDRGIWWSSVEYQNGAMIWSIRYDSSTGGRGDGGKQDGFSVRCVKD